MKKLNLLFDKLLPLLVTIAFLMGMSCASLKEKSRTELATQALLATQTTVVSLAGAADDFCTAGVLTQPQCDLAADAYTKAKVSYDLAADMLALAIRTDDDNFWRNYQSHHAAFFTAYQDLTALAIEFDILKGGP